MLAVTIGTIDGQDHIVSGGADGTVRVWDLDRDTTDATLTGHTGWVLGVAITGSGSGHRILSSGQDGTIRLWDLDSANSAAPLAELTGHNGVVRALAASPDGRQLVSAGGDGSIQVWDVSDRKRVAHMTGHAGRALVVAIPDHADQIVTGTPPAPSPPACSPTAPPPYVPSPHPAAGPTGDDPCRSRRPGPGVAGLRRGGPPEAGAGRPSRCDSGASAGVHAAGEAALRSDRQG